MYCMGIDAVRALHTLKQVLKSENSDKNWILNERYRNDNLWFRPKNG